MEPPKIEATQPLKAQTLNKLVAKKNHIRQLQQSYIKATVFQYKAMLSNTIAAPIYCGLPEAASKFNRTDLERTEPLQLNAKI